MLCKLYSVKARNAVSFAFCRSQLQKSDESQLLGKSLTSHVFSPVRLESRKRSPDEASVAANGVRFVSARGLLTPESCSVMFALWSTAKR